MYYRLLDLSEYVEIVIKFCVFRLVHAEHFTSISLQFHKNQPRGMYFLHKCKFTKHKNKNSESTNI